jgi:hypothetical protein
MHVYKGILMHEYLDGSFVQNRVEQEATSLFGIKEEHVSKG